MQNTKKPIRWSKTNKWSSQVSLVFTLEQKRRETWKRHWLIITLVFSTIWKTWGVEKQILNTFTTIDFFWKLICHTISRNNLLGAILSRSHCPSCTPLKLELASVHPRNEHKPTRLHQTCCINLSIAETLPRESEETVGKMRHKQCGKSVRSSLTLAVPQTHHPAPDMRPSHRTGQINSHLTSRPHSQPHPTRPY